MPAVSAGARSDTNPPNEASAPQAVTSVPADAPSVQKPDDAQSLHDELAQPTTAAGSTVALQEPGGSAQHRDAAMCGTLPSSGSAVKSLGSPLLTRQLQAEGAHNVSPGHDDGNHLIHFPRKETSILTLSDLHALPTWAGRSHTMDFGCL